MIIDRNGILLKEKVNMDFLKNLEVIERLTSILRSKIDF